MRVPDITNPMIQRYIENRIAEAAANGTINRELSALKRAMNIGARQTPPKVDRVPYIPMLRENNTRKGFFEHGEYKVLLDALPYYLKDFVTFAYKSGWRISEIAKLRWNQVDIDNGIISLEVGETKNDEARTFCLDEELKKIFIQKWKDRKDNPKILPYVFINQFGTDRIKRFDKAWKRACKDAGIGVKFFHDLRRTAVRNMVRAGIPERVAMMVSGHKTRSVFDRYNIVNDKDLKLASQKLSEHLENQTVTKTVTIHQLRENI
jgi:integrase